MATADVAPVPADSRRRVTRVESVPIALRYIERIAEITRRRWSQDPPTIKTWVHRIRTDDGTEGVGEWPAPLDDQALRRLIGRSPFEAVWDDRVGAAQGALHDLVGKLLGVPAGSLFGPRLRDRVVSAAWSHAFGPDDGARELQTAVQAGFTQHLVKIRTFGDAIEQVEAMAAVAPAGYRMALGANGALRTVNEAIRFAREVERLPSVWALVQPIPIDDLTGLRRLRQRTDLAIGLHTDRPPMFEALRAEACDFFLTELETAITTLRAAAVAGSTGGSFPAGAMAAAFEPDQPRWLEDASGLPTFPILAGHSVDPPLGHPLWLLNGLYTGLSNAHQLHVASAIPNALWTLTLAWLVEDDLIVEPMVVEGGTMAIPTGPGLGVTLDENALERVRTGPSTVVEVP